MGDTKLDFHGWVAQLVADIIKITIKCMMTIATNKRHALFEALSQNDNFGK